MADELFDRRLERLLTGLEVSSEKIQNHERRITDIESNMIMDSRKRLNIKRRVEQRVRTLSGPRENADYQHLYRSYTRQLWHEYWNAFGVTTYHDTPAALYETVINFIDEWIPNKIKGLEEPKSA
jgi:hypothetical protein